MMPELKTNNSAEFSNKAKYKVPFGTVSITDDARGLIQKALESKEGFSVNCRTLIIDLPFIFIFTVFK